MQIFIGLDNYKHKHLIVDMKDYKTFSSCTYHLRFLIRCQHLLTSQHLAEASKRFKIIKIPDADNEVIEHSECSKCSSWLAM